MTRSTASTPVPGPSGSFYDLMRAICQTSSTVSSALINPYAETWCGNLGHILTSLEHHRPASSRYYNLSYFSHLSQRGVRPHSRGLAEDFTMRKTKPGTPMILAHLSAPIPYPGRRSYARPRRRSLTLHVL